MTQLIDEIKTVKAAGKVFGIGLQSWKKVINKTELKKSYLESGNFKEQYYQEVCSFTSK